MILASWVELLNDRVGRTVIQLPESKANVAATHEGQTGLLASLRTHHARNGPMCSQRRKYCNVGAIGCYFGADQA